MIAVSLVLLAASASVRPSPGTAGRGFAPSAASVPAKAAKTPAPTKSDPTQAFLSWAESEGIKQLAPLKVTDFNGERCARKRTFPGATSRHWDQSIY